MLLKCTSDGFSNENETTENYNKYLTIHINLGYK